MIRSGPFSRLVLTGDDARAFLEQLRNYQPNAAAEAGKRRVEEMKREFEHSRVITIRPNRPKKP